MLSNIEVDDILDKDEEFQSKNILEYELLDFLKSDDDLYLFDDSVGAGKTTAFVNLGKK